MRKSALIRVATSNLTGRLVEPVETPSRPVEPVETLPRGARIAFATALSRRGAVNPAGSSASGEVRLSKCSTRCVASRRASVKAWAASLVSPRA